MKNIALIAGLLVIVGVALYLSMDMGSTRTTVEDVQIEVRDDVPTNGRIGMSDAPQVPPSKLKADVFSGVLEKVDTGCFADGECYVEVGGKHVTALMGWSRDTVGSVQGVEGFGDLESHIGSEVEVYAQDLGEGKYTLYGSEGFYIKLK